MRHSLLIKFWGRIIEVMPKGKRLKQNLLLGVINVVSGAGFSDNLICQNLELVSNLVNTLAPCNCARVCSTEGRM